MAIVGGTFVLISGALYFAFMAAWLTVFVVAGPLRWVTAAAGVVAIALAMAISTSCTHHLLSGVPLPDRSRPVAMIETRGGVEYGATTTEGILFLGRTATEGPCRVHYFLGGRATPMIEDGEIRRPDFVNEGAF